ncbi:hypothetical protein IMSAG185_01625 [Lachnospiraceae bacterium]|nr:hypothetical protein IMSAG185_01625 [Lachnospiraceae bacterium]
MLCGIPGGVQTEEVPEADADHALLVLLYGLYKGKQTLLVRDGIAVVLFAQILAVHKSAAVLIAGCQIDAKNALQIAAVLLTDIGSHGVHKILGKCALQPRESVIVEIRGQICKIAVLDETGQAVPAAAEHQVEIFITDHDSIQLILVVAAGHPGKLRMNLAHDRIVLGHLLILCQNLLNIAELVHDTDLNGGILHHRSFAPALLAVVAGLLTASALGRAVVALLRVIAAGSQGKGHCPCQSQCHPFL